MQGNFTVNYLCNDFKLMTWILKYCICHFKYLHAIKSICLAAIYPECVCVNMYTLLRLDEVSSLGCPPPTPASTYTKRCHPFVSVSLTFPLFR